MEKEVVVRGEAMRSSEADARCCEAVLSKRAAKSYREEKCLFRSLASPQPNMP